jgi:hypothetical protein
LNIVFAIKPKALGCDNGKEFANNIIENMCKDYNIELKYGLPYNPKSQGAIEAFNKHSHKNLLSSVLLDKREELTFMEMQTIMSKLSYEYNNTVHTKTKYRPRDLIYLDERKVGDCQIAEDVKNNLRKVISKNLINDLKEGEKCLMGCNFRKLKNKNCIAKNSVRSKKKGDIQFYKIPITIVSIKHKVMVKIKISKNFCKYELKKNEEYTCDYTLIKKCSEQQ